MAKYRKKPIVIEAVQWFKIGDSCEVYFLPCGPAPVLSGKFTGRIGNSFPFGDEVCEKCGNQRINHGQIGTLEGPHIVCPGDWIITGVKGEHYACKPDIFEATYEIVEA